MEGCPGAGEKERGERGGGEERGDRVDAMGWAPPGPVRPSEAGLVPEKRGGATWLARAG